MTDDSTDLVARLALPDETGLDLAIAIALLRLLASGDPVEVTTLAATAGRTVEQTRAQLAKRPDTEYGDAGGSSVRAEPALDPALVHPRR
nr:hypothetical protein [Mycobacterium gordonae]